MNWRKITAAVATLALATSLLAGCTTAPKKEAAPAPGTAAGQKVTLELWSHWGSEQRRPTINKIVETWNKANPNVQVNYVFVPWDQIITKTLASVAAGNPPDAVVIDLFTSKQRAAKKQNTDLSQFGADTIKDQFYPNLWNSGTYQGKQYALPFVTDTRMLFYDKAAFKEVGLDPNKGPVSWADLKAYADKLDKKEGNKITRVGFHPLYGNVGADLWITNGGGSFFDDKSWPTMNTPKNIEVMDWVKGWSDRYGKEAWASFSSTFQGGANDAFLTGKVAMQVQVATYAATIKKYKPDMEYGMVAIPTPDGKQHARSSSGGGFNVEIPAGSKHPKEAYEFIKWFATEGAKVWGAEQYDMPGTTKAAEINDPVFKTMVANMPYTFIMERPLTAPDWGSAFNKAKDDIINGTASSKDALNGAQKAVEKMVQENTSK